MSKVIQYYHSIGYGFTSVVHVPTKEECFDLIKKTLEGQEAYINVIAGCSFLHPEDKYVRKTGRHVSLRKSKCYPFKLNDYCFADNMWTLNLVNLDETSKIESILLEIRYDRPTVFFVCSSVNKGDK